MHDAKLIFRSFGLFYKFNPLKLTVLFVLTLVAGFTQGITVVLLIPLLGLLQPSAETASQNHWSDFFSMILNKTGQGSSLLSILFLFAVCMLLIAVMNYFKTLLQSTYQQDFSYFIRKKLYHKVVSSDWEFLNRKGKHNYIQVITTEIPKVSQYYYYYLDLATKFVFIAAHVIVALFISVQFTLFVVVAGLLVLLLLSGYLRKASKLGYDNIKSFRSMLKKIDDFWMTVKLAKVHHSESFYYGKFEEANEEMHDFQNQQIRNRAFPQFLYALAGVAFLIIVVYLSYSYMHIPLTSLFVLIVLFGRIFPHFGNINTDINMMVSNTASVKLVLEMYEETGSSNMEEGVANDAIEVEKQIKLTDCSFSYPDGRPIFDHFNETIPAKSITGIVGLSGCGKTTLLDLLCGLLTLKGGSLTVDGKPLGKKDFPSWRKGLGYLLQDSFFVDGTVRENLVWDASVRPDDKELMDILHLVNADHLILGLKNGLDTYITNYQYHFSGGERQRLALARVLIRKPKILFLDEATSSLDPENEKAIMETLCRLKHNVTIIFVTHREYLKSYFDKLIAVE
jgi:ATP-binding cassette subfamily C protein